MEPEELFVGIATWCAWRAFYTMLPWVIVSRAYNPKLADDTAFFLASLVHRDKYFENNTITKMVELVIEAGPLFILPLLVLSFIVIRDMGALKALGKEVLGIPNLSPAELLLGSIAVSYVRGFKI